MTSAPDTKALNGRVAIDWTDERVATLTKLRQDGCSAAEIALAMGDNITRNAVIGKLSRLGLVGNAKAHKPRGRNGAAGKYRIVVTKARNAREMATAVRLAQAKMKGAGSLDAALKALKPDPKRVAGPAWEALPGTTPISLLDATDATCRWPIGDPLEPGFGFCGCATAEGSVYCAEHRARATTTFKATADDKRKLEKMDRSRRVFA